MSKDNDKKCNGKCSGGCKNMTDNHKKEIDEHTGVETTGHEWDGLKELNNPAPRWWLWVFLITFIWSVGYWIVYPAWPTIKGHTEGIFGWTQYEKLKREQEDILVRKFDKLKSLEGKSLEEIKADAVLYEFAMKGGASSFKDNCATCHGTGAQGWGPYPNLNDDSWLWGGSLEEIHQTIVHGIRSKADEDTRDSMMPAFGKDGVLTRQEISTVADYVFSLSGKEIENNTEEYLASGKKIYEENCSSCHGVNGEGNKEFGAPRLNDALWLRGGEKKDVVNMIYNAKMGMMPNWGERLDKETIKMLTIYVHSLGGGE